MNVHDKRVNFYFLIFQMSVYKNVNTYKFQKRDSWFLCVSIAALDKSFSYVILTVKSSLK